MKPSQPIIVAHRGLHDVAPENSARAFRLAAEEGFQWAECDVWASADGMPIVIHDETLDRTTFHCGTVSRCRADRLLQIKLKDSLVDSVPWLPQVCNAVGPSCGLLVEIKPWDAAELVRSTIRILQNSNKANWMIQSFDPKNLMHGQSADQSAPVALLVETDAQLQRALSEKWPAIHSDHRLLNSEMVDAIHDSGGSVGAWTVNLDADIRRMIELHVDMIITDEPRRARDIVANA